MREYKPGDGVRAAEVVLLWASTQLLSVRVSRDRKVIHGNMILLKEGRYNIC